MDGKLLFCVGSMMRAALPIASCVWLFVDSFWVYGRAFMERARAPPS
jgi:hypothetical protein